MFFGRIEVEHSLKIRQIFKEKNILSIPSTHHGA